MVGARPLIAPDHRDTRPGYVAFVVTWSAFAVWFLGHIVT